MDPLSTWSSAQRGTRRCTTKRASAPAHTPGSPQDHDPLSALSLRCFWLNKKGSFKVKILQLLPDGRFVKINLMRSILSFRSIPLIFKNDKGCNQNQTLFNLSANNNPAPCLHSSTLTTYSFDALIAKLGNSLQLLLKSL